MKKYNTSITLKHSLPCCSGVHQLVVYGAHKLVSQLPGCSLTPGAHILHTKYTVTKVETYL